MAYANANIADKGFSVSAVIRNAFSALARGFVAFAESNPRLRQVEQLSAMSDAELAKLNIKRQDIVRHVFRDVYYV